MRKLILPCMIALFTSIASATPLVHVNDGLDYAVPKDSPVQFASIGQYGVTHFQGRFTMSGSYHYGYISNDPRDETNYRVLELYFLPDNPIRRHLPFWKERGEVQEMRFKNENDFVAAVISQDKISDLKSKKISSVSGRVSIAVEAYQASVECDYPTYSVTFVSIEHPQTAVASRDFVEQYGC